MQSISFIKQTVSEKIFFENLSFLGPQQPIKTRGLVGPENAHLKPDPGVLSHHEITLTLNTHTPLLNS